jgi:uncharacterized protein YlxW (UPF0749 family)
MVMIRVSLILSLLIVLAVQAGYAQKKNEKQTRAQKKAEIERIQEELKPLREKARKSQSVIDARKKVDEAMTEYYRVLRNEMIRIDPSKKPQIEREATLQRELRSKKRQALNN